MHNSAAILLLGTAVSASLLIVIGSVICHISPMPSSIPAKRKILDVLKKYGAGTSVVDLGSGWGTLVFAVAAKFPGTTVTGYELSPVPFL